MSIANLQKNSLTVSVVFCTYQRPEDLTRAVTSVLSQTRIPTSIIIIDNSGDDNTEHLCKTLLSEVMQMGITFQYHRNHVENSLTMARNLGASLASDEVVLFLDDDVELDINYISEILFFLEKNETAVAVHGYIERIKPHTLKNRIYQAFGESHYRKNLCRSLMSISIAYPYPAPKRPIKSDFLSGANHAVRRLVYEQVKYDTKLTKYSEGEDLDFSLRVARLYPDKVWLIPSAKLVHHVSSSGRLPKHELVMMQEVYGLYLNYKLYPHSLRARVKFIIHRLFKLAHRMLISIRINNFSYFKSTIAAYWFCIRHWKSISSGSTELI